ncbi:MAG: protein kinase [Polyangiaceae bacterium]|nr:protein kinase [Polyangiaceae bacterium]
MKTEELPSIGDTLAAKYRLTRQLGRGGMGAVYEATHLRLGQKVAIKVVLPEVARRSELAFRFEHEARVAARLRGRHTVRVLDIDVTPEGLPYLVMELLEGRSLRDELVSRGPLPVGDAVRCVREACEGVSEVHRAGIVHRDLKPANLFLSIEEGGPVVKVVDFGIAKTCGGIDTNPKTTTDAALGTYKYMSPEQAKSARSVDARTDVWSLGVVLYELLTGKTPFVGEGALGVVYAIATQTPPPLRASRPDVPEALAAVVERALCKELEGRYQTAQALSDDLAPFEGTAASPLPRSPGKQAPVTPTAPARGRQPLQPTIASAQGPAREATPSKPKSEVPPAALRPAYALVEDVPSESVTSGSKSHVVPIKRAAPATGAFALRPWFVRGAVGLVVGGSIALSVTLMRVHPDAASVMKAVLSEEVLAAEMSASAAVPASETPTSRSPRAAETPASSPPSAAVPPTAAPPAAASPIPPPQPSSRSAGEGATAHQCKATSGDGSKSMANVPAEPLSASPLRPAAKPQQKNAHQGKPIAEPAPSSAASAATTSQAPKERRDVERFEPP